MQQVWVGAVLVAVGLLFCFFGQRIARIVLGLGAAALGYTCGLVVHTGLVGLLGVETMRPVPPWAVAAGLALLFGLAAYGFYVAGVLLLLGSIGWGLGQMLAEWTPIPPAWQMGVSVLIGLVMAGIGVAADIPRKLMVVGTVLLGSALAVAGGQQLTGALVYWLDRSTWGASLQPHLVWLGAFAVLVVAGLVVQFRQHGAASLRAAYGR